MLQQPSVWIHRCSNICMSLIGVEKVTIGTHIFVLNGTFFI
jgi:hypothetical protein